MMKLLKRELVRGSRRGRASGLAGLSLVALSASVLNAPATQASVPTLQTPRVIAGDDAKTDRALDSLARSFAVAMRDPQVRRTIHDSVGERFDGDTNTLWKTLSTKPGVRTALGKAHGRTRTISTSEALGAIDRLAADIPRFQIAVPANLETWNPDTHAPLVAFAPTSIDDTELKTVTAYNSSGESFQLDATTPPEVPVVVLGLNERTDDSGQLLSHGPTTDTAAPAMAAAAAASYEVRMIGVFLLDSKEPWTSGAAEISMKARSRGCSGTNYSDSDWSGLNYTFDSWSGARYLGNTTCDVTFYWWEDDGGSFDYSLSFSGHNLGVRMDNRDDRIGGIQLPHSSFSGGSDRASEWSALIMTTD